MVKSFDIPSGTRKQGAEWKDRLGRLGLVGRGGLYSIVALLALELALGAPTEEASPKGAMAWLAQQPFSRVLLIVMTIALFAMAAWRLLDAAVGDPVDGDQPWDRVRFLAKGAVYMSLAIASLSTTLANWHLKASDTSTAGGKGQKQATAVLLSWPLGQWIVAAVGAGVIGYAIFMFKHHAIDQSFMKRLVTDRDSVRRLGQAGYGARTVVWAITGVLLIQAAITFDPNRAGGLSTSLQKLAQTSGGGVLLIVVAVGLFAFAGFCFAEAKYRRAA